VSKWQKLDRQDQNELVQYILGTAVMVFFVAYLYGGVKAVEGSGRWLYPLYMSLGWIVCGVVLAWWVTRREDSE
jgi:Na+-driven multidrug efflux pump